MDHPSVSISDFPLTAGSIPVLDVRSPGEFAAGHIPGAVSFPLFSNEERAVVGTIYKQKGRRPAIRKGLEITGPKMPGFIERAEALGSEVFAMYCWRGGMRSGSLAWLLRRYGFEVKVLDGGYKSYRHALAQYFEKQLPLLVLSGYTGSRKTEILHQLARKGAQVIDLEGLAGHQGSSFGNKKCTGQPTTEQFQNDLYNAFLKLEPDQPIWIEDENIRVGRVNMPESLFRRKGECPHVVIEVPKRDRIDFLVEDYGTLDPEKLAEATLAIRKKLGFDQAKRAVEHIRSGDLHAAVDIILTYYDKYYERALLEKRDRIAARIPAVGKDPEALAEALLKMEANAV